MFAGIILNASIFHIINNLRALKLKVPNNRIFILFDYRFEVCLHLQTHSKYRNTSANFYCLTWKKPFEANVVLLFLESKFHHLPEH